LDALSVPLDDEVRRAARRLVSWTTIWKLPAVTVMLPLSQETVSPAVSCRVDRRIAACGGCRGDYREIEKRDEESRTSACSTHASSLGVVVRSIRKGTVHPGLDRLRIRQCEAAPCIEVFVDRSRNGRRVYCSRRCADRVNASRHRQRGSA
jgi:hypothetical protein